MADGFTNIPTGKEAINPASAETVRAITGSKLDALRQLIAPTIVTTLTIAGMALIYWYAMKAIVTGENPLETV